MATKITRRDFIKGLTSLTLGTLIFGSKVFAAPKKDIAIAIAKGPTPEEITKSVINKLGGMKRFVSRGDIVAIKPNLSFARPPEQAATTNPQVIKTIVELCYEAGAKKVRLTDNTCNTPTITYNMSGVKEAAEKGGAEVFYPKDNLFKEMNFGGKNIKNWPVYTPFVECDCLINVPIAKHHSLAKLTLGMKNWFGAVGGNRGILHRNIDQTICDMANFFKPNLTVIDAVRILVAHGPSGGDIADVRIKNTVIASTDPVVCDAKAAGLFNIDPRSIGYITMAENIGLGKIRN